MKNFKYTIVAVIFMAVCTTIAAIMGLIEARDKKQGKRRPLPPMRILIYTTEWIRRITKHITTPSEWRCDHLIRFKDGVCRLSPEMMAAVEKAPVYTMAELEEACNSSQEIVTEQNLETILI